MMNGVTFGNKHSYRDFKLILKSKEIKIPTPKIEKIDVFGMDGDLDVTDIISDIVRYKNRSLSFTFEFIGNQEEFMKELEILSDYLHGKKMQVILDADPAFFYYGRCTINQFKTDKRTCTFQIDVDADPYKMEINKYVKTFNLNGQFTTAVLENLKRIVVPEIVCSNTGVILTINGMSYELSSGRQKNNEIQIIDKNTEIMLSGYGTVTFEYRRGLI